MDHRLSLPSPCLPAEICDYILDYLWDDHKTLQVCSLVTREWLPETRRHLFHFVRIISNERRVAFEDVISHSGGAVALGVRVLDLWERNTIPVSLPQMLASLGRLEKLTLRVYVLDDCSSSAETIAWPVLPMVKTLHVKISVVNDIASLQRFICACPSLSSLNIQI
ncbi:uncharacterized protein LAESUDRAFT_758060 [Laetiporus sulphureus 93-53]|uniref:F-box domain-containing protein n=1 Tax=Laetiporus sulphureus 93-53 TaxID=1314785 RepID=A0A165EXJ5_9APHY|nr:uncharacterized protein LAESUDRAFT_758060 [Laetiporus sulphureus 93-53]KZT07927.1 hypothetical protein LAESUDRAFT_758060 [Laetiporus sulphureus 93-53]